MIPRAFLVRIAPYWVACLIVGSFLPGPSKDALGTTNPPAVVAQGRATAEHRLAHFIAFGSTALILVLIAKTPMQIVAALSIAVLGLMVEFGQYELLNLPHMEWWDVRGDTLAALGSLLLAQWRGLREVLVDNG
jgi:hypothetical protein